LDNCASNFNTSNQITFVEASLLFPLSLSLSNQIWFPYLPFFFFSTSLLSLGAAGWWILNPCGLLGGGFFFQFAWLNLIPHNLSQNHSISFTSSHFFSSFSSSSIYLTNQQQPQTLQTLLLWLLPNQLNLNQPRRQRQTCTHTKHKRMELEKNLELMLMKFQVVQTLFQIGKYKKLWGIYLMKPYIANIEDEKEMELHICVLKLSSSYFLF